MRTARTTLCLVAALAAAMLPIESAAQPKPRIAVLDFQNNSTFSVWGDRLGHAAADELTTQLVRSGHFSVLERQQIEAILAEQHAGMSGAIDPSTAAQIGKVLGAQAVLLGSITQFSIDEKSGGIGRLSASYAEAESKLDVRIVDTNTAEVLTVAVGSGKRRFGGAAYKDMNLRQEFNQGLAQEALRPAVEDAIREIVAQKTRLTASTTAAVAQIVGVRDGSIYIDRGENFGLEAGQRLEVVRVVDVIKDSNGNVLDEVVEKVGTLQITRVLSQSAICSIVEGEAKQGDRIRLVS